VLPGEHWIAHEVGWRHGLGRQCELLGHLRLSCFSPRLLIDPIRHANGPDMRVCRCRRRLLRGHAINGLLHHGGYWRLRRRRLCGQTHLVSSFWSRSIFTGSPG
jgi:hypothetical protein